MRRLSLLYLFLVLFAFASWAKVGSVRINEICQSNVYHVDENMYLPDSWIELYNDSEEDIDLEGWRIVEWGDTTFYKSQNFTNDQFHPMGFPSWRVPLNTIIPAKGYKLIYCDEGSWGMHMFFKLSTEAGHNLALYDKSNNLIDILFNIPETLYPDVSYGRVVGNDTLFSHFAFSTPNAPNEGAGEKVAPKIVFSKSGGVYEEGFDVELSCKADSLNDYIYYTLDGSEPTYSSKRYDVPLKVSKTTLLRARVLKEGLLPRNTQTQSYLFPDHDIDLPIMSLVTDSKWLCDDSLGIYQGAKTGVLTCYDSVANYVGERFRYVSIEYFEDKTKDAVLNQQSLVRICGGCSRIVPQKSMIVKTNKRMPQSSFKYPLWTEKPQIKKTKSFMLRNSGQDYSRTMFRDAAVQHLLGGKVDLDIQAYQPCVLYINGQYWGIYNIRERSNEKWVNDNYDLDDDEFDAVENYSYVKTGSNAEMLALLEGIQDSSLTYEEIISDFDTQELINHIILEMFSGNIDWPHNNVMIWNKKDGGKWRFLCKDIDYSVGLVESFKADVPLLSCLYNSPKLTNLYKEWADKNWNEYKTRLMRYFLSQKQFVKPFLEKSIIYLGTYLQKDSVTAVIDSFAYRIENEMFYHRNKWEGDDWNQSVSFLREQLGERSDYCYKHISDHYGLGAPVATQIVGDEAADIKLYDMSIPGNTFNGKLFSGMPARLKCSPDYYWRVSYKGWDGENYSFTLPDSTDFVASPKYRNLIISAVNDERQDEVTVPECEWWFSDGVLYVKANEEPLDFVELFTIDGKTLCHRENVDYFEMPLHKQKVCILRYKTKSNLSTFKVLQN